MTSEVDLLLGPSFPRAGEGSIAEALQRAGFQPIDPGKAVWQRGTAAGERVEFMVAHIGTAAGRGSVVQIESETGLGAIALDGLEILQRFITTLSVPVQGVPSDVKHVEVRVPTLAAYLLNKAGTFPYRPTNAPDRFVSKRGNDILYLRDLAAAGEEVIGQIESGIRLIAASAYRGGLEQARSNLYLLLHGAMQAYVSEAALALAERERMNFDTAAADVRGHLTDLLEILVEIQGTLTPVEGIL